MEDKKYCCEVFPKILKEFNWFYYKDEKLNENIYVMPYIESREGDKWKVNYCPSCGANVMDTKITYDEIYNKVKQ